MALTTCTPLIAIAYHKKTYDFMNQFDMAEYCINDTELSEEKIDVLLVKLQSNSKIINEHLESKICDVAEKVEEDISELISR